MASSSTPVRADPTDWVTLISPNVNEGEAIDELGVPRSFMEHALDADELPRMKAGPGGTLLVLRVPVFYGDSAREPWGTQPIALAIMETKVVAISRSAHPVLDQIGDCLRGRAPETAFGVARTRALCGRISA
jgi:hypothetical protein